MRHSHSLGLLGVLQCEEREWASSIPSSFFT